MFIEIKQNIFDIDVECLVNPVNLVGVMGAGLAKQFKEKYPDNYIKYKKWCKNKHSMGSLFFSYEKEKLIINFPTKEHWTDFSKLEYIEKGLITLNNYNNNVLNLNSIAIPPLGCGLGGLNNNDVKNLILTILDDTKCKIYLLNF